MSGRPEQKIAIGSHSSAGLPESPDLLLIAVGKGSALREASTQGSLALFLARYKPYVRHFLSEPR